MGRRSLMVWSVLALSTTIQAQQTTVVVKPKEISDVLVNPGIGFTTFQRFNGDTLNQGKVWTEGYPIDYQPFNGNLETRGSPMSSIAYFRIYWRFIEPEKGVYRWDLIDKAISTARERHQTLMLRVPPYGTKDDTDVPAWYRQETEEKLAKNRPKTAWDSTTAKWMVNAEPPAYAAEYGAMIRALGQRYDGNPDLELVDISLVGAWGEDAGAGILTDATRRALVDSYLDSFHKTLLVTQLADEKTVAYTLSRARGGAGDSAENERRAESLGQERPLVGWRADCMGDMGTFSKTMNLMNDSYPEQIIQLGVADVWKTAPVTMEACSVMQVWKDNGWDLPYIIEQAEKWHVSSFNAKSSAVPTEWATQVNEWLNHMGYRFVLRRFSYPAVVDASRKITFTSWWENKGNAPAYRRYPMALRLRNGNSAVILATDADVRTWLPGDNLYNDSVFVPASLPDGNYILEIALVDPVNNKAAIKLAIAGREADGWYPLGSVKVDTHSVSGSN